MKTAWKLLSIDLENEITLLRASVTVNAVTAREKSNNVLVG